MATTKESKAKESKTKKTKTSAPKTKKNKTEETVKVTPKKLVICTACGEVITGSPKMINGRKYCEACEAAKLKEGEDYKALVDYIFKSPYLVNQDNDCMPTIHKQILYLYTTDKYKYEGMLLTLKFIYETKDNGIKKLPEFKPDVGIINMMEKYYPIAGKREREKRVMAQKAKEGISEEVRALSIDLPTRYICISQADIIESNKEAEERIKDRLFGPKINLDDIPDEEDEE